MRPQLAPDLLDEHFGIEQVVGEEHNRQVGGRGLPERRGIGDPGHDDIGAKRVHDAAGFVDRPRRRDSEVQAGEDGLTPRVAVLVVVDDQHERGIALAITVTSAAAPGGPPVRAASMLVFVVHAPKGNNVAHARVGACAGTILAASRAGVKQKEEVAFQRPEFDAGGVIECGPGRFTLRPGFS